MREIKFRAWDKKKKIMGFWSVWNPKTGTIFNLSIPIGFRANHLMQFTGLKDKQGKEIYEGDICKSLSGELLVIKWAEKQAKFIFWCDKLNMEFEHVNPQERTNDVVEVIGNIYENKSLLKGGR